MDKFTFFHCYTEDTWEGYEKNGLLRENFGIRFPQSVFSPDEKKFNKAAAKGGKLYNYIKEHNCPLYVDRAQGGTYIEDYEFDTELIEEYKRLLGDKFLGFQIHEWMSNYWSDACNKLGDLPEEKWTEQQIEAHIRRKFPFNRVYLESMNLQEMAEHGKPETFQQFYNNMTDIYKKRAKKLPLVPCDSFIPMYPFEAANGAKVIMPEVGAQTCDIRIAMCFARGVCKANGITMGAYYEPWGGHPLTCCCYHADEKNEWDLANVEGEFPYETGGINGGSSRSLQKRIYLYAYLCGAKMISEEWGGYNTFVDRKTFALSEYGMVKKDFLDFVDRYPDLGDKLTPIAAVISNDALCYPISQSGSTHLYGLPVEEEKQKLYRVMIDGVLKIFSNSPAMVGTETGSMRNSNVPDAVDMLNEGDGKALEKYDYLVDLTADPSFAQKHNNCICAEEVPAMLDWLLPCKVSGGLHYLINRRGDSGYYLSVFNNSGVVRTQKEGESVLPEATQTVEIELKDGRTLTPLEGSKNITIKDKKYYVTIGGGDWFFAAF